MPASDRNRAIFRTMQADVVAYVEREGEALSRILEHDGVLDGPQVESVRAIIEEVRRTEPTVPACEWDAPWIPNGDYSVTLYNETSSDYLFRIHLVTGGVLAGKRIVKYKAPGQRVYRGFGFVTKDGGFSIWRRFQGQSSHAYVNAIRRLFESLAYMTVNNRTSAEVLCGIARREQRMNFTSGVAHIEGSWKLTTARCIHCNAPARITSASRFPLCIAHGTIPVASGQIEVSPLIGADRSPDPEFERLIEEEQARQDAAMEEIRQNDLSTHPTSRRRRRAAPEPAQRGSGPMMDMIEGKYVL